MPRISESDRLKETVRKLRDEIRSLTNENSILRIQRDLAGTDTVTGLPTYNKLTAEKMQWLVHQAERLDAYTVIAYFDIDDFKSVNDKFGHPVGDIALRHIAQSIQKLLRKVDFLTRKGGDEFIALMTTRKKPTASELNAIAERFKKAVAENSLKIDGATVCFSTSIGVKTFDYIRSIEEEFGATDKCLYADKNGKKNGKKKTSKPKAGKKK